MKYVLDFTISLIVGLLGAYIGLAVLVYLDLDGNNILRLIFVMTGALSFHYLSKYCLRKIRND